MEPAVTDLLGEAQRLVPLSHPNIASVYEVGPWEGSMFIVMEYVEGGSLDAWLRSPRSTEAIIDMFFQAGHGLAAAHACGIVHRDFKPQNVLIGRDGRARVTDFGLSRATPRYQAPEVRHGGPATPASDVFAFCMALSDALAGREVAPALRAKVVAGVAQLACVRPTLTSVIATLEQRRRPKARWLVAGGAVAVTIGVACGLATVELHDESAAYATPAPLLAGGSNVLRKSELERALGPGPDTVRIVAGLDDIRRALDDEAVAARTEEPDDEARAQCLERRALELAAVVDTAIATRPPVGELAQLVEEMPRATDCRDAAPAPLPTDRDRLVALYRSYAGHLQVPVGARTARLIELEHQADDLGEQELSARAAIALGAHDREVEQLADAEAALRRAYASALSLHAQPLATLALVEQSLVAADRGEPRAAVMIAEAARASAGSSPELSARVHAALAHAARAAGDDAAAIAEVASARQALAALGHPITSIEIELRFDLIRALAATGQVEALELAQGTLELVRDRDGAHSHAFGVAADLVAYVLTRSNATGALTYRRSALDVMIEVHGPDHAAVARVRCALARDLAAAGQLEAAHDEGERVLAQIDRLPALRALLPEALASLAQITERLDQRPEAMRLYARAVDESVALAGASHPRTLEYRLALVELELDLGKLEPAAHQIAALQTAFADDPRRSQLLRGVQVARLLRARKRPDLAEPLVRTALAAWSDLHGDDHQRVELLQSLGACLVAEHHWSDARTAFEQARALDPYAPRIAEVDVRPEPPRRRPAKRGHAR